MPSSRKLLKPGIEPSSVTPKLHWQVDSLPLAPPGKPMYIMCVCVCVCVCVNLYLYGATYAINKMLIPPLIM